MFKVSGETISCGYDCFAIVRLEPERFHRHFIWAGRTRVFPLVVVGRDAEVFQLLPFDVKAWHAGKSFHAGRVNLIDCSIGIELDNILGSCNAWGDRYYSSFGRILPIRCTRRKKRRRDTGILLPRAVQDYGGDL